MRELLKKFLEWAEAEKRVCAVSDLSKWIMRCEEIETALRYVTDEASPDGNSLRDYFAAQCLNGLITATPHYKSSRDELAKGWAVAAYTIADAMIEARKAKEGK